MMRETFETEFGERIPLASGVEDVLTPNSNRDAAFYEEHLRRYYATAEGAVCTEGTRVSISQIENDVQTFALLADFMEELNVIPRDGFASVLDIAGAEGVHAALFRGLFAAHAEVADLRDGRDPMLTPKLLGALAKRTPLQLADSLFEQLPTLGATVERLTRKRLPRSSPFKRVNVPSKRNYYPVRFRRTPAVDRFLVGDWRKLLDRRYDVILSFQSFWLFEHRAAMTQIADHLEPEGLFATLCPYSWCGRSTGDSMAILGGAFPFFEQRLTKSDIRRYYETYKPDRARFVDLAYDAFDPARPTLRNYVDAGLERGLVLVGYKRSYFKQPYSLWRGEQLLVPENANGPKTGIRVDVDEVLGNIRHFRDDVFFEDLLTRSLLLVFRKVG